MAETLFPQRQRCKACRGSLGRTVNDPVLLGLYCSAKCAGMAEPAVLPDDAPRGCRTQREGRWAWKKRYRSVQEIPAKLREDPSTSWYVCEEHCGHWHLGHSRMGTAESYRGLKLGSDLRDVLVKRRGKATRSDVARVAGIRPIRLKELEEGTGHEENLVTLFKVAPVLGLELGVAIKQRTR
ncbi:hypothetical protein [Brevibacterium oceani]|uniref:hypothetical protein n=1 Tax=Brevibacterium oceani TaxID=358099 RepID=UPI0015E6D723|nr:hypothetical protein [Brevibacterium oceani]